MLFLIAVVSCKKEMHTVTHVHQNELDLKDVKVVNEKDPICDMKTADYLQDTAIYKGKIYGFCSANCKNEFKKDPEKYVQK